MKDCSDLVIVVKVNPASQALDRGPPFRSVAHDNGAALLVVLCNSNLLHSLFSRDTQLLVNLVFDRESMSIPSKPSLDVIALHRPVSRDDVLDGGRQQMAIMRKTCSEWRAIIECVRWATSRQFELLDLSVRMRFSQEQTNSMFDVPDDGKR